MQAASIPRIIVQHRDQARGGLGRGARANRHVTGRTRHARDEGIGGRNIAAAGGRGALLGGVVVAVVVIHRGGCVACVGQYGRMS